ncbi:unnamed protein product, partial [Rotaria sp. Silwood2]
NSFPGVQSKCHASTQTTDLKEVLRDVIPKEQKRVSAFKAQYKDTSIGQVTIDMIYGGMRGIKGLVYETSLLDPNEGIRFRGKTITECQKLSKIEYLFLFYVLITIRKRNATV